MRKNIFTIAIIAIIFVLSSCEKEELSFKSEVAPKDEVGFEVRDGYLVFKNNDSFVKTVSKIANMNKTEREKWEKSIDFVSQARLINDLIDNELELDSVNRIKFANGDISNATKYDYRPELFYNLLSKGVIKLIDEGTSNEYWDFSAFNKGFSYFINEEGLYAVGDSLFQVTNKELKAITLSSGVNKGELLKELFEDKKGVSKIKNITDGIPGNSPGLIESTGNFYQFTKTEYKWPSVNYRIKLGIELSFLAYSLQTARFDFTHNYYVTSQKTNFWNNWINDYANYNIEGSWTIEAYYYGQSFGYQGFNYNGTAISGVVHPDTGERMYAGTTFSIFPNEANQTYDYYFQQSYQPKFTFYKWKVIRTNPTLESFVKSYTGPY
jgi:hypothetical protein